ncbi:STAS domain-containing protein [Actinoplanes aureus]|jgi:anti-anti-sigma factor|uniref:STAS domain-containing protein n=1 Tax=Actinoplanes aureus TaxID=2792083 RepID=A0A931C9B8_9ACTN|nr:STAS domain-containing protein [Actinoplanes aureus]MBG0563762.1 STAS domain-containing protein [Actinoplanes aureus]
MDLPWEPAARSPELSVTPAGEQAAARLTVSGDLDLVGAPDFLEQFEKSLPALPGPIEMDLGAVDFIDCAGARAVLRTHELAVRSGHRITVVGVSPAVALIFDLLGYRQPLDPARGEDR